jgi:hypothetical protein
MLVDVIEAKYVGDYRLHIVFENGMHGIVDLEECVLGGGVFEPLSSREFFSQVVVDRKLGTIAWPNGADVSPEFLYQCLQKTLRHE